MLTVYLFSCDFFQKELFKLALYFGGWDRLFLLAAVLILIISFPLWLALFVRYVIGKISRELFLSYTVAWPLRWARLLGYANLWHFIILIFFLVLLFYFSVLWFNLHLGQRVFCQIQNFLDFFNGTMARPRVYRVLFWWSFYSHSSILFCVVLNILVRMVCYSPIFFPALNGSDLLQGAIFLNQPCLALLLTLVFFRMVGMLVFNPFTYFASGFEAAWHGYYCPHVSVACRSELVPWYAGSDSYGVESKPVASLGLVVRLYGYWEALVVPRKFRLVKTSAQVTVYPNFDSILFLHYRSVGRYYRTEVFDGRSRDFFPVRFIVR